MEYRSNRNVTFACHYHVVFCPKYRRAVLEAPLDQRVKDIAAEVCKASGADLIEIEVMPDHVHLLVDCDPQFGINRLVRSIKGRSASILRREFPRLKSRLPCLWTNSYFVATVGGTPLSAIKQYIESQKNI